MLGALLALNLATFIFMNIYAVKEGRQAPLNQAPTCLNKPLIHLSHAHKLAREKFHIREDLNLINALGLSLYRKSLTSGDIAKNNFCDLFFINLYPYEEQIANYSVPSFIELERGDLQKLLKKVQALPNSPSKFYISYNIFRKLALQDMTIEEWDIVQSIIYSMHTSESFRSLSEQEKLFFSSVNLAVALSQMKEYRSLSCVTPNSLEALIGLLSNQYIAHKNFDGAHDAIKDHLSELDFDFVMKNYTKICKT